MRLFGTHSPTRLARQHLQSYSCALVRSVLEESLSGRLDALEGAVFPHTCDAIMRLSDIWRMQGRYAFFSDVVLPVNLASPAAPAYMVRVLERFKSELETASGRSITEDALRSSIKLYNRLKGGLARLYDHKTRHPRSLTYTEINTIVRACQVMDREAACEALETLVAALPHTDPSTTPPSPPRVLISGSVCDTPDLLAPLEASGAVVVGDDLCTGQRFFDTLTPLDTDPLAALGQRYLERMVCPAKHRSLTDRADTLIRMARKSQASGVVFFLLKFCDPHAFDLPDLERALEGAGIKTLVVETDGDSQEAARITTRMETFVHTLEVRP